MSTKFDLTTLASFKNFLDKDDTTNDSILEQFITQASISIESFTKRKLRSRTLTSEDYDGDGTRFLFVKQYPIVSVTSLYDDTGRDFTSTTLKASTDYIISNEEGIVELAIDAAKGSIFNRGVKNVRLTYVAGFDEFIITAGVNDALDWKEDAGAEINSTLDADTYTANALATEIKTQLDADGSNTYTVTHNKLNGKFYIATDGTSIQILSNTGTNVATSCAPTLGFDTDADPTAADPLVSDNGVLGIPEDLQFACNLVAMQIYRDSGIGGKRFDVKKVTSSTGNQVTRSTEFIKDAIPKQALAILQTYKRILS